MCWLRSMGISRLIIMNKKKIILAADSHRFAQTLYSTPWEFMLT
jgi:hypothetical protein